MSEVVLKVDESLDRASGQAFSEMCRNLQMALHAVTTEHNRLQDTVDQLKSENQTLRAQNKQLQDELTERTGEQPQSISRTPNAPPKDEAANFSFVREIKIHESQVHSVAMDQESKHIATASWDGTVKLYNLAEDKVVNTLGEVVEIGEEGKMSGLYAVAFAKTANDVLGCTSCDKSVYLWNHQTGRLISKLTGHSDEVNGIDFHPTQQVMCTASDDCKVIIWDFQEGITLRIIDKHAKAVYGATFLGVENQYLVASCCFDEKTRIFDMRDKTVVSTLQTHTDDVIGIDYCSSRQLLATGSDDGTIGIWDTRTWKLSQKIDTNAGIITPHEVKRIGFSPAGDLLAGACSSGLVLVYDVRPAPAVQHAKLRGHSDCVFDVSWGEADNTRMLVSASHDHTCRYWREVPGSS